MNACPPTQGQLALATLLAEGGTREDRGVTHVDAAHYTDPARHRQEQAHIFGRLPLVIAPSALLPEPAGPVDLAAAIAFLAHPSSRYVTGQLVFCDAGAALLSSLSV